MVAAYEMFGDSNVTGIYVFLMMVWFSSLVVVVHFTHTHCSIFVTGLLDHWITELCFPSLFPHNKNDLYWIQCDPVLTHR